MITNTKILWVVYWIWVQGSGEYNFDAYICPTMFACLFVLCLFSAEGANVDAVNDDLLSPLNQALTLRHVSIIALLLRAGCRLDSKEGYIYYKAHYR